MYSQLVVTKIPLRIRFEFRKARETQPPADMETPTDTRPGTLYAVYIIGGRENTPCATGIQTNRSAWISSKAARPNPEAKVLLKEIAAYESLAEQVFHELQKDNRAVSAPMLRNGIRAFVNGESTATSLEKAYAEFRKWTHSRLEYSRAERSIESISQATYDTYPKRWAMIHDYLRTSKQLGLSIENIDYPFAFRLKEWMQAQRQPNGKPYQPATLNKVISLLKQIMTFALRKGYTKQHALHNFSCRGGSPANPKPLTEEMMDHLETCELPYGLRRFCDSWLVAAELCLHYADFSDLASCVFIQRGERRYLQRKRSKQQGRTLMQTVDVTERAERILAKYGGVTGLSYTSSAYFSKLLKQIAEKADLRDEAGQRIDLQFGMGRDTGLTLRAIDGANGIQLSKIAGWSKPAYAERYIGNPVDVVAAFAETRKGKGASRA